MAALEAPLMSGQACINNPKHQEGTYQATVNYFGDRRAMAIRHDYSSHNPLDDKSLYGIVEEVFHHARRRLGGTETFYPLQPDNINRLLGFTLIRACTRQDKRGHEDGVVYQGLRPERVLAVTFVENLDLLHLAEYSPDTRRRMENARKRGAELSGIWPMSVDLPAGPRTVRVLHLPVTPEEDMEHNIVVAGPSFVTGAKRSPLAWVGHHMLATQDGFIERPVTRDEFNDMRDTLFGEG